MIFEPHHSIFVGSAMSSPTASPVPSLDENSVIDIEQFPRRARVVSTCRNCAMTFRVNCKSIGEFCSKDCHTTFTVFGKQLSSCCRTPDKSATEIRTAIYQFQKYIDNENAPSIIPTEAVVAVAPIVVVKAPVTTPPMIKKHKMFGNIFSSHSSNSSPSHSTSRIQRSTAPNFF